MSILDELEDLKKQAGEIDKDNLSEGDDLPEEIVEEGVEEEPEVEEEVKEEPKEEPKEEVKEEKLDDSAYARIRRELAAEKKRVAELEAANKEEPDPNEVINAELIDVIEERRRQKAELEFSRLEQGFAQITPGYEDTEDAVGIASQYKMAVYNSIRTAHPRLSHMELLDKTKETLLKKAGTYLNQGFDPIEEMYHDAVALGIKPQARQKPEVVEEGEVLKPDLSKVAANKRRNAGMAAAKGASKGAEASIEFVANGGVQEWLKLSPEQKKAYFAQLGVRT